MLASICAQARTVAVAGTHGKTTTTSMLMLILAEAGLAPSFVVGGDVTDAGTGAQWTGGELARRRGRRERRHPPRAAAVRHDPHQRRGRPPRPLRHVRRASSPASTATSPHIAGPKVLCADDPALRATWPTATAPSPTGCAPDADFRAVDVHPERRLVRVHRRAPRRAARDRSACPCAACTTSSTPPGRWRWRSSSACRSTRLRRGARPLRRRRPALRHPRRRRRRHVRRRLRPPAEPRSPPCSPRPAQSGDGWQRVIAVFQPNRFNRMAEMSRRLRRRLRRRRRGGAHRDLRVGHDADPRRHRASSSSTPCSTPIPTPTCVWLPRRDDLVVVPGRRGRPRRRVHLDGLRRRRHAPRGGARPPGAPGSVAVIAAAVDEAAGARRRRRPAVLGELAERDVPLGPLTTYRVGGPAALFVRPRTLDDLRRVAASPARPPACRCSSSGGAPTCWWPTPASSASRCRSPTARRRSHRGRRRGSDGRRGRRRGGAPGGRPAARRRPG